MNNNYGKHGEVKSNRVKVHAKFGMNYVFTEEENVKINMNN